MISVLSATPTISISAEKVTPENMVKNQRAHVFELRKKARELRDKIEDTYLEDHEYKTAVQELENKRARRKELKKILGDASPKVEGLKNDLRETNKDLRFQKKLLSGALKKLKIDRQMDIFEGMKIVEEYKLIKIT